MRKEGAYILPTNPGPQQAWRLGAAISRCLSVNKNALNLLALPTPNLRNSNSAKTIKPTEEDDDATVLTDNRSTSTTRVATEEYLTRATCTNSRVTTDNDTAEVKRKEETPTVAPNRLREKWKRKVLNRAKTKRMKMQDKRNWGMARTMSKSEAWNAIVDTNRLKELPRAETIFDKSKVVRQVEFAISDSGATAHFLVEGAPIVNLRKAEHPVTIKLPDGTLIQSTHIGNLDIPWMPDNMTEAHIVPGLSHSSLISTKVFCDAGCKVIFDEWECRVYHEGQLMLSGG